MVCPECGQLVEDNYSFCKNCGCPVNPTADGKSVTILNQEAEKVDYSWDDEERGNGLPWLWLTLAALALIGGAAGWLYWQNGSLQENPVEMDTVETVMVVEETPTDSTEAVAADDIKLTATEAQSAEAHAVESEEYDSYDEADIEEVKSWIQGNWRYRMVTESGPMETRIGINGDYLVEMINGEMTYSGEYTIDGDVLRFSMGKWVSGVIYIDRVHRRLMATETEPMTRF